MSKTAISSESVTPILNVIDPDGHRLRTGSESAAAADNVAQVE